MKQRELESQRQEETLKRERDEQALATKALAEQTAAAEVTGRRAIFVFLNNSFFVIFIFSK